MKDKNITFMNKVSFQLFFSTFFDEMQVINHNRVDEKALTHEYKKENSHKRNKSKISNMPNRQSTIE